MNGTLATLIANRCGINAYCTNSLCQHSAKLDPLELALKFGENAELPRLKKRLRCKACGGSAVHWMPSWPISQHQGVDLTVARPVPGLTPSGKIGDDGVVKPR